MGSASSDRGDDYVPTDYTDLLKNHGPDIIKQIARQSKIKAQIEDLTQHTLMKIVENRVIEKYNASSVLPRTMTGEQAAAFCGVAFPRFKVMIWRGFRGDMRKKTEGDLTRMTKSGIPRPLRGGWASKKSIYATTDIVKLYESGAFKNGGTMVQPRVIPATKVRFRAYLMTAVNNIFKNFCRTIERKDSKDITIAPLEDGTAWEAGLVDTRSCNPETALELKRTYEELCVYESGDEDQIAQLIERGHSRSEIKERLAVFKSIIGRHQEA